MLNHLFSLMAAPSEAYEILGEEKLKLRPGQCPGRDRVVDDESCKLPYFFVLVEVNDLFRVVHFDRDLRTNGNIPEHAALGSEFKILLTS